jgi:hypothetical protein
MESPSGRALKTLPYLTIQKHMATPVDLGAQQICKLMSGAEPWFIGRNGTIELEVILFWFTRRQRGQEYPPQYMETISRNAGVFPATKESIDAWCDEYCTALAQLNGLAAGWYKPLEEAEASILSLYAPSSAFRCPLRSLEPYYVQKDLQWTRKLAGKRVTVVSSFAESIRKQVESEKFPRIWSGDSAGLLNPPGLTWSYVRTGYAPALALGRCGWPAGVSCWQDAVEYVVEEVQKSNADVAIIGCGGLGMLIGAELKRRGISAIVLGGATQVLFGLKGTRWATHPIISDFWNDAWVWPSEAEKPNGAVLVEGGCYW